LFKRNKKIRRKKVWFYIHVMIMLCFR
jgi:hypothetical protein